MPRARLAFPNAPVNCKGSMPKTQVSHFCTPLALPSSGLGLLSLPLGFKCCLS